jgi:hypothetical protein
LQGIGGASEETEHFNGSLAVLKRNEEQALRTVCREWRDFPGNVHGISAFILEDQWS